MSDQATPPTGMFGQHATASPELAIAPSSSADFGGLQSQPASSPASYRFPTLAVSGVDGSVQTRPNTSSSFSFATWHGNVPKPPNNGTSESALLQEPIAERDAAGIQHYQTCTFRSPYWTFSLEELRLADYKQGRRFGTDTPQCLTAPENAARVASGSFKVPADATQTRPNLQWLQGGALEIHIGPANGCTIACCDGAAQIWHLPKALLSQHFELITKVMDARTASKHIPEVQNGRLLLPQEHQGAFVLFVEWLYYGSYTLPDTGPASFDVEVAAYHLAEKLCSGSFINYVMAQIYERHKDDGIFRFTPVTLTPVTPTLINQVFRSTSEHSLLRKFYLDYLEANFTKSNVVKGSTVEWDRVMQDFPEIRMRVLEGMRADSRPAVKPLAEYMSDSPRTT